MVLLVVVWAWASARRRSPLVRRRASRRAFSASASAIIWSMLGKILW